MITAEVKVRRLRESDLPLPRYQTAEAAGLDLVAEHDCELAPMARELVGTGLALELPGGFEGQIRPRSGLAFKEGITCLNSPGTIDSDYRGEVKVLLVNLSTKLAKIRRGDRIAQLVIAPVCRATLVEVETLAESVRGGGGFGSTGVG
jgi:dUTP pyrophosphatase